MSLNAKKVVLASGNKGKLAEIQDLLKPLGWTVLPQSDFFSAEAEETGLSFIENAILKARFAAKKTGLPAIADDSGLEVLALKGRPGIYSARYSADVKGLGATDAKNNQKLLAQMQGKSNRQACYYCAVVLVRFAEDPTPMIGLGQWCGEVLTELKGKGGFGYDPAIWLPQENCSVAELSSEHKNKRSHRALALQELISKLQGFG